MFIFLFSSYSRYAASGAAYGGANTLQPLTWCTAPDRGLPKPDLVLFLEVSEEAQETRSQWGEERFEKKEFQKRVKKNFLSLSDETWHFVDASKDKDELHKDILNKVQQIIENCKDKPIGSMFMD